MTTNYHTPITLGAAGNSTIVNAPLADLDEGVGIAYARGDDALTIASANLAELAAARSPYASLDERLDAFVVAGGNVATKTNGVSAAGQKVITVDATDGFIVGSYVTYFLNGTTLEGNVIGSIQAGVSLTMVTNVGASPAGGVLDDSYISMISLSEYLAAQAIPHAGTLLLQDTMAYANRGVYNVQAYGATGDGTTDDQAALEAAWSAMADGDTLVIPAGIYAVSDTVLWQDADNITILAHNATIKAKSGVSFANKALVDMAGSQYCNVVGLRIDCALVANLPKAGLVLARNNGLVNGGSNKFDNCWFTGKYSFAVVYEVGSELSSFWHCRFLTNVAGIPTYYTSSTDDAGIAENTASNVCKRFYDCTFLDYSSGAGQVLIEAQGVSKELGFRDCYMAMSGNGHCIELNGTGASMYGLVIDNVRVEGTDHADSRLLYINQDNATTHSEIKQVTWTIASDFVIEVCGSSALRYSSLSLLYPMAGTTKWMRVSNNISYCHIVVGKAETISIDSGDTATVNYVVSFGDGSPFTGAGTHDASAGQTNITASLWDAHSEIGVARKRTEYLTLDSDSTPSVEKRDFLFMNYAAPTTITDFTDAVHGQTITLVTANGNITIDDSATIVLKGRVNWTMPTSATLTLRELGGQWYEVGRMDPS